MTFYLHSALSCAKAGLYHANAVLFFFKLFITTNAPGYDALLSDKKRREKLGGERKGDRK